MSLRVGISALIPIVLNLVYNNQDKKQERQGYRRLVRQGPQRHKQDQKDKNAYRHDPSGHSELSEQKSSKEASNRRQYHPQNPLVLPKELCPLLWLLHQNDANAEHQNRSRDQELHSVFPMLEHHANAHDGHGDGMQKNNIFGTAKIRSSCRNGKER